MKPAPGSMWCYQNSKGYTYAFVVSAKPWHSIQRYSCVLLMGDGKLFDWIEFPQIGWKPL